MSDMMQSHPYFWYTAFVRTTESKTVTWSCYKTEVCAWKIHNIHTDLPSLSMKNANSYNTAKAWFNFIHCLNMKSSVFIYVWFYITENKSFNMKQTLHRSPKMLHCDILTRLDQFSNPNLVGCSIFTWAKSAWRASRGITEESWEASTSLRRARVWLRDAVGPRSGGGSSTCSDREPGVDV